MRVRGHLVRYRVAGEGPPVVLVHGLAGSARWWAAVAPALARSHRVIVPELPGFGFPEALSPLRLADAPDVLGRLLERLGEGRPSLVGHSLGGLAALGVAARRPEGVDRLVMIAPAVRTASTRVLGHALPVLRTLLRMPPAGAATVLADVAARSPVALWRAAGELLGADHAADLAGVRAPTLLLWGDRDLLVPPSGAFELARLVPGARVRVLPGAGHVPMLDRPAEVVRALLDFLPGGR